MSMPAHKLVLMASSPYFRAMFEMPDHFSEGTSKGELTLTDSVEGDMLEPLLTYFYSGSIEITLDNVESMLYTASLFLLEDLVNSCAGFLESALSMENCRRILELSQTYSLKLLQDLAENFIGLHFENLRNDDEFMLNISHSDLCSILERDCLNVPDERSVFTAVSKWVSMDDCATSDQLARLWSLVRYPKLPRDFLLESVSHSSSFSLISSTSSFLASPGASELLGRLPENDSAKSWQPWMRRRTQGPEVTLAHAEGSEYLELLNNVTGIKLAASSSYIIMLPYIVC